MPNQGPSHWLMEKAATGLKDMPTNVGWLLGRAGSASGVEEVAGKARDTWRSATAAVQDASPLGDTSVETRLKRARAAGERAKRAEDEALEAATIAKQLADDAKQLEQDGRAHVRSVKTDTAEEVKQRVARAKAEADAMVQDVRERAQADAEVLVERAENDVRDRVAEVRERAESAQAAARSKVADATELMAEARRLADEAAEAAQAAAREALRDAMELAEEAERQATAAGDGMAAAEAVQQEAADTAALIAVEMRQNAPNGSLSSMTKAELVDLASALGLEDASSMTKQELVAAVNRESKKVR